MSNKRAASVGGHVEQRHGRWYVVLENRENGKRRRKWLGGDDGRGFAKKGDALALLAKVVHEKRSGTYIAPATQTTGEYLAKWHAAIRPSLKQSTWRSYELAIRHHLTPAIGHIQLRHLTTTDLDELYSDLLLSGLSPKTVRNIHLVIRKALGDAVKKGRLSRNVAASTTLPKMVETEMHSWNLDEVRLFLNSIRDDRLHALYHLALTTGMRRGELCGLRKKDVDLAKTSLQVRQTLLSVGYEMILDTPKSDRSKRRIDLDPATIAVLKVTFQEPGRGTACRWPGLG